MANRRYVATSFLGASMGLILFGARVAQADEARLGDQPQQSDSVSEARARYHLAIGGDLALGGQGFDAETIGGLAELNVRWQLLPVLGLGGTFAELDTGRELTARVIGLNASFYPLSGLIDPYLRVGPVYFADIGGKLQYNPNARSSRLGVEAVVGLDFAWRHLALGPEFRYGRTDQGWGMLGLHVEGRL